MSSLQVHLLRRSLTLLKVFRPQTSIRLSGSKSSSQQVEGGRGQGTTGGRGQGTTSSKSQSDSGEYKVAEYYQYNKNSYYDIEKNMITYRLEQPKPGEKY